MRECIQVILSKTFDVLRLVLFFQDIDYYVYNTNHIKVANFKPSPQARVLSSGKRSL